MNPALLASAVRFTIDRVEIDNAMPSKLHEVVPYLMRLVRYRVPEFSDSTIEAEIKRQLAERAAASFA